MSAKMLDSTKKALLYWNPNKTASELMATFKKNGCEVDRTYFYTMAKYYRLKYKLTKCSVDVVRIKEYFKKNTTSTIQDCADSLGLDYKKVGGTTWRYNIPHLKHKKAQLNKLFRKEVVGYLLAKGFSYQDIGRLFGVKRQAIEQMYHGA